MKKLNVIMAGVLLGVLSGVMTVSAAGPAPINLGSAANFTILAKSGISTTGSTIVTGNIGLSPAAATFITGFGLISSVDTTFATTPTVVGNVYAATYTNPTPSTLTTAVSDMETAYVDGGGRSNPTATELGAGNIGGLTIAPGLYKWGTGVVIPANVTLSGSADDVWVFQIAGTLTVSSGVQLILSGGAQARNVFWVVAGQTTIGTTADFSGNVLGQTTIVLNTGARLTGRALAQTAVTLDANTVTFPTLSLAVVAAPVVVPTPPTTVSASITVQPVNSISGTVTGNAYVVPLTTTTNLSGPSIVTTNTSVTTSMQTASYAQMRSITANLSKGSKSNDVAVLQNFLISQNKGQASVALMKVGATSYYGVLTRAALAEYQASVGISPALGYFGPITRAYISTH